MLEEVERMTPLVDPQAGARRLGSSAPSPVLGTQVGPTVPPAGTMSKDTALREQCGGDFIWMRYKL